MFVKHTAASLVPEIELASRRGPVAATIRWLDVVVPLPAGWSNPGSAQRLLGEGIHAVVYQVVRSDGTMWALKLFKRALQLYRAHVRVHAHPMPMPSEVRDEIELARLCKLHFGNPVDVVAFERQPYLLIKSLIPGQTLKTLVESGGMDPSTPAGKERCAGLLQLLRTVSAERLKLGDLNPGNLIYHQQTARWVIIDGDVRGTADTVDEALAFNKRSLTGQLRCTDPLLNDFIIWLKSWYGHGKNRPVITRQTVAPVRAMLREIDTLAHNGAANRPYRRVGPPRSSGVHLASARESGE
jgi:hypothetical protein